MQLLQTHVPLSESEATVFLSMQRRDIVIFRTLAWVGNGIFS